MISIIIPAYNEESVIQKTLLFLKEATTGTDAEIIVVDGGSTDNTVQICKGQKVQVFLSDSKGRAAQMNFGAKKANGELLYFLHADSIPPATFLNDISRALANGYKAGCYRLGFYPDHFLLKVYAWFTRFDIDLFRFGDQSLFVTKSVFTKIGGFRENLAVMEDQQIITDLKKMVNFRIIPKQVITSSRKYERIGMLKLQFIFFVIVVMYYMRINQDIMVDFYSRHIK